MGRPYFVVHECFHETENKNQQPAITENKEIQVRNETTNPAICGLKDEQFLIQYFLNFDF
jgi:hypothetical protein